jgi:hypothetical protein
MYQKPKIREEKAAKAEKPARLERHGKVYEQKKYYVKNEPILVWQQVA